MAPQANPGSARQAAVHLSTGAYMPAPGGTFPGSQPAGVTLRSCSRQPVDEPHPPIWRSFQPSGVADHRAHIRVICVRCGRHIGQSAATMALVGKEPEDERHRDFLMYDFGQATANMMLAAADLGIGSGHSAVIDQEQAQRVLGFPGGYVAVYLIGLGYPADRPLRPLTRPNRRLSTRSCTGTAGSAHMRPGGQPKVAHCGQACRPGGAGIWMSRRHRSGRSRRAVLAASAPVRTFGAGGRQLVILGRTWSRQKRAQRRELPVAPSCSPYSGVPTHAAQRVRRPGRRRRPGLAARQASEPARCPGSGARPGVPVPGPPHRHRLVSLVAFTARPKLA